MYYICQILEQALLMYPLVLGIYVSFSVCKIADLTVDGSFLAGAAVFATLSTNGVPIGLAMLAAILAGALSGVVCAIAERKNRVDPLIVGILMAFMLHSLSLVVMARPNIGLLQSSSVFNVMNELFTMPPLFARVLSLLLITGVIAALLGILLSTRIGLWLKAFGNNQNLVAMLGKNPENLRIIGLALGNGLAAFSGCLTAQASGYADINMGFGQALVGIAMILLGKEVLRLFSRSDCTPDAVALLCVLLGIILYFFLMNELIRFGLDPVYLKMAIGIFLMSFLLLSSKREAHVRELSS